MTSEPFFLRAFMLMGVTYTFIVLVAILILWRTPPEKVRGERAVWTLVVMMIPLFGMMAFALFGREHGGHLAAPPQRIPAAEPEQRYDPQQAQDDLYGGPSEDVLDDLYGSRD